ncbi:MAG: hypothetical protein ACO3JL_21515 [Myxococcota bacterium]
MAPGQLLVLGRSATRADFQTYWQTSFGSDVVYLDAALAGGGVPNVNGGETWALVSPVGTVLDVTIAGENKDSCYHRESGGSGTSPSSWSEGDMSSGRPGATALPTSGVGLVFSQWCDAEIYQYEFLELYYAP